MGKIGIITDDMTGTMTCGVLLAKEGIRASSYFSPENLSKAEEQDAVILSANSRSLGKEEARANVKAAYQALTKNNVQYFTKRIDTTFRGGIGHEVDALLEEMPGDTMAVMAAAMPDTRRVIVGGYSLIDGVILSETGAAKDVLTPVTQAHIPTLMKKQSVNQIGEIHLNFVLSGKEVLKQELQRCRQKGDKILVIDGVTNEHLRITAEAVHELEWNVVCVDPGAFTQKLALCRGFGNPDLVPDRHISIPDIKNSTQKVLVVAGSATEVTKKQLEKLEETVYSRCLSIHAGQLISSDDNADNEIKNASDQGNAYLREPDCKILILETAVGNERFVLKDAEKKYGLIAGEGSQKINAGLGKIAGNILFAPGSREKIAGIYMTGGDTLVTVLKTSGAAGICLIDTVQPQTNLGTIIGGKYDGTKIVGKGGLIGSEETAVNVVNRLFFETTKEGGNKR